MKLSKQGNITNIIIYFIALVTSIILYTNFSYKWFVFIPIVIAVIYRVCLYLILKNYSSFLGQIAVDNKNKEEQAFLNKKNGAKVKYLNEKEYRQLLKTGVLKKEDETIILGDNK